MLGFVCIYVYVRSLAFNVSCVADLSTASNGIMCSEIKSHSASRRMRERVSRDHMLWLFVGLFGWAVNAHINCFDSVSPYTPLALQLQRPFAL